MSTSNVSPKKGPPDLMVMLGVGKGKQGGGGLPPGSDKAQNAPDDVGSSFVCPACREKLVVESAKDEAAEGEAPHGSMPMGAEGQ